MEGEDYSAERMAQTYLAYVLGNKADNRHVASWLGFFFLGVDSIKDRWWVSRSKTALF
jgi:hypothetical protein